MKVDLSQFVGVNTGKNENPRRNDAIARGDVSKAHGQAIKRRAEKNLTNEQVHAKRILAFQAKQPQGIGRAMAEAVAHHMLSK